MLFRVEKHKHCLAHSCVRKLGGASYGETKDVGVLARLLPFRVELKPVFPLTFDNDQTTNTQLTNMAGFLGGCCYWGSLCAEFDEQLKVRFASSMVSCSSASSAAARSISLHEVPKWNHCYKRSPLILLGARCSSTTLAALYRWSANQSPNPRVTTNRSSFPFPITPQDHWGPTVLSSLWSKIYACVSSVCVSVNRSQRLCQVEKPASDPIHSRMTQTLTTTRNGVAAHSCSDRPPPLNS